MNAPISAAEQYRRIRAAFLAEHVRPCGCDGDGPLDLRQERVAAELECATCARLWIREAQS